MIHTTMGVYNSDDFVTNGVADEHLESHIEYNKKWRFGRALFVDGKCVHQGYLSKERCDEWENKLKAFPVHDKCTAPYK